MCVGGPTHYGGDGSVDRILCVGGPTRQIAEATLKTLFQRIRQPVGAPRETNLPTPLVVRQST